MITLNKEKETLLVPLYGKAIETQKKTPVLYDEKAVEIIEKIDYDFKSLRIPRKTNTMMCLRAKLIDNFAEGLFMYLKENEIRTLLNQIKERTDNYTLIFDAFSIYTAQKVKNHPSIKKTGAQIRWGIDNTKELEKWNTEFKFVNDIVFTFNEEIEK
ncbi:MAG: hypothetical protein ACOC2M_01145 [bacterium]